MNRQETVARELDEAAADLATFIQRCPDDVWSAVAPHDGRTVASLAYHCASGNDLALGWICQLLSSRAVQETPDTHNAANDAEAIRSGNLSKADVGSALRRTTERTAYFLRSLTDEELDRKAMHGVAGREMSVGQFIGNFGRHMRLHLETLSETLEDR